MPSMVLHRDVQMVDQVDDIAAKLDGVFAALKTVEELSAKRIAAVEKLEIARPAAACCRRSPAWSEALAGQGDAPGLVEFRRAAALAGVLLSEASLVETIDRAHVLRSLFDVEAQALDRLAPAVATEAPEVGNGPPRRWRRSVADRTICSTCANANCRPSRFRDAGDAPGARSRPLLSAAICLKRPVLTVFWPRRSKAVYKFVYKILVTRRQPLWATRRHPQPGEGAGRKGTNAALMSARCTTRGS